MKILLSFLQDKVDIPHDIPAYRFWTYYIKKGIEESGMQWFEVPETDWAAGLLPFTDTKSRNYWSDLVWAKTLKYIKANLGSFDVFLCYLYPFQVDFSAIKEIQKLGIPCVNFYCDHVREFTQVPDAFKVFDLMWVPEFEALAMYKKTHINYIHLPMPIWVDPKYRSLPTVANGKIAFIGSKDELRVDLLADVISSGMRIEIRGSGWSDAIRQDLDKKPSLKMSVVTNQLNFIKKSGWKGFAIYHLKRLKNASRKSVELQYILEKPGFEDYISITRESSITLGINRVPTYKRLNEFLVYSRLRDLEAPMLGACYLTEYTAGLSFLYEIGQEIETYSDADELVYKCRELMSSSAKQKELRIKGQKKALNEHSVPHSLNKIKNKLFQ